MTNTHLETGTRWMHTPSGCLYTVLHVDGVKVRHPESGEWLPGVVHRGKGVYVRTLKDFLTKFTYHDHGVV